MKKFLQHNLNSLHIYCKLRKIGLKKDISLKIAGYFEVILKPIIY
jgi:hypothetical protein